MRTNSINLFFRLIVILELLLISCDRERPETCTDAPSDGLISFYDFQGDANDHLDENNGIGYNVEYFNSQDSENKVLLLNGINSYVDLQTPFDYEVMTISLWFYAQDFNSIFDLIYTSDNPALSYGLLNISIRNDDGVNNLYFNVSGQYVTVEIIKNSWYHVTIIRNKKEYKYYLNSFLIKSGTFENYVTSDEGYQSAIIGCKRTFENGYLKGFIDNLRIYNKVLSEKEINILFECQY